eukprot:6773747-Pyramimonas_sp.AAC.1
MRADEDTFLNSPTTSAPRPYAHDEKHAAWIIEKNPLRKRGRWIDEYLYIFVSKRLGVGAVAPR